MRLTVDGRGVRCRVWGERGPCLLLLGPIGLDADCWAEVAAALASRCRVLAYDFPGHGASDPWPGPYTLADLADQAAALLRLAGHAPAAVAGLSMGGMVALQLALRHPDVVASLVLADTLARGGEPLLARARLARAGGMAALVGPTLERWFPPEFAQAGPRLVADVTARLAADDAEQHALAWEAIAAHDVVADLGRLRLPTLVVVGELDVSTPPDVAAAIAAAIPGARLERLAGAGHMAPLQLPLEFARLLAGVAGLEVRA